MRLAALLTLLLIGGCLEARAQDHASLPGVGVGGVGGSDGFDDLSARGGGPIFDLNFADGSGIAGLSSALASTGATIAVDCSAATISGTDWACSTGGTWAEAGAGASPTSGLPAPLTATADRAVEFDAAGKYYDGPASAGAVTTEDVVIEAVFRTAGATTFPIAGTMAAGPVNGWRLGVDAGTLAVAIDTTAGAVTTASSGTIATDAWYHALCYIDRDSATGLACALNGTVGATGNPTVHDGTSADGGRAMDLGGLGDGSGLGDGRLASLKVWRCADCLSGAGLAAIAAERFAALNGTDADIAAGQSYPSSFTRATIATLDVDRDEDGVRRAFTVGSGWPRVVKRPDSGATLRTGYLSEPQATNLVLQSARFDTSWALIDAGDTIGSTAGRPDGSTDKSAIIGDATDGQHGVTQAVTLAAVTNTFSVWAKAGAQGHLYVSDDTVANAYSYFDLSPCAVGTNGAGASGESAEDWGDGWCRVSITYTGTAAAHTHRLGCAPADNDNTFSGDGATTDCTLWGAQIEAFDANTGWRGASSYIATTTASVTRNADDLVFSATGNVAPAGFTIGTSAFCRPATMNVLSGLLAVTQNTGANNFAELSINGTQDPQLRIYYATASQAAITAAANVYDGSHHEIRGVVMPNDSELFYDSASVGTDVSVTMPVSLASIYVGDVFAKGYRSNCVTTRARSWAGRANP